MELPINFPAHKNRKNTHDKKKAISLRKRSALGPEMIFFSVSRLVCAVRPMN